jgi:hypothetical protein
MEKVVVVLAFKTVYTLELKRRSNEKRTIALYVEMKDMMGVLLECVIGSSTVHYSYHTASTTCQRRTNSSDLMEETLQIV